MREEKQKLLYKGVVEEEEKEGGRKTLVAWKLKDGSKISLMTKK